MKILIACEESQIVTKEFRKLGHEAYSCDILSCSGDHPKWHFQQDVIPLLQEKWDMMIAHPPCTYLSNAGNRWFNESKYGDEARERKILRLNAFSFVMTLINADIPRIALENPVGWINSHYRKSDQIIQPYMFGDTESKRTCLWLKNLPLLVPTKIVKPKIYGYYKKSSREDIPLPMYWSDCCHSAGHDRGKTRSKTFPGIAKAMASQWG